VLTSFFFLFYKAGFDIASRCRVLSSVLWSFGCCLFRTYDSVLRRCSHVEVMIFLLRRRARRLSDGMYRRHHILLVLCVMVVAVYVGSSY